MREPDRRRRSGRALGAIMVLGALTASFGLSIPGAWAQTPDPTPTETPTQTPTETPTQPPTQTSTQPPTQTSTGTPTGGSPSDPTMTLEIPGPPDPTSSNPAHSGDGTADGRWSAASMPTWASKAIDPLDPLRRWRDWTPTPGTFDTSALDRFAERMRERGWTEGRIRREVYAPFIVVGPATWSDSWGALRLVAGPRPHQGQDVLCTYGAPVLATEAGTVTWSTNSLGGLAAYLHRADGSFYYYAHLSATPEGLPQGARVDVGDVIGSCGATGNASVPHVHFSYVNAAGTSIDPMERLRGWLRTAERRLPNPPPPQVDEEAVAIPSMTIRPAGDEPPPPPPLPEVPEPPGSVATGAAAALESPVTVPAAMLLVALPLLGLLRRRTREPSS